MGGQKFEIEWTAAREDLVQYQYYLIEGDVYYWDGTDFHPTKHLSLLFDIGTEYQGETFMLNHGSWETVNRRRKLMEEACRNIDIGLKLCVIEVNKPTPEILEDINLCLQISGRLPKLISIPA